MRRGRLFELTGERTAAVAGGARPRRVAGGHWWPPTRAVAPEMAARVVSVEVHEIADLGFAPWCEYQMRHINGSAGISKR